ncbi:uncharacterized protein ATC70_008536 [Mucor velutinosus]|uniref:Uncharacterized protein n=1 Tax=Mucor velutinosus TaxID=708070 RepID=A0AAN7I438_9FUNG|nr:hypothetical protein ATC70_008536 [Mucor velutinosus]
MPGFKVPRNGMGFLTSTRSLFNNAEKIIEFRFNAMTNLIEYLRSKIAKQDKVIDQAKHELKQLKYYKSEMYELEQENAYLRSKVHQMQQPSQEYYHDFV